MNLTQPNPETPIANAASAQGGLAPSTSSAAPAALLPEPATLTLPTSPAAASPNGHVVQVIDVVKSFPVGNTEVTVLKGISFNVKPASLSPSSAPPATANPPC